MNVRQGWVEKFHDDELIVPLSQLSAVREALQACQVEVSDRCVEENEVLALARLSGLTGIEAAARQLEHDPSVGQEVRAYRDVRNAAHPEAPSVSDLALLIKGLLLQLDRRYPGWEITIGKNYRPSLIRGYPHTEPGGEGKPTPVKAPFTGAIDPTLGQEGGRGVRVGLLDTRLFPHPSLTGRYIGGPADLQPADKTEFTEFDGHCTFVASCILQQAPAAQLYLRSVLNSNSEGTAWEAAVGIADLATHNLDVVNLSFGEYMTDDDSAPMVLAAAIRRFSRDTVVIAAAGNNGNVDNHRNEDVPPGVTPHTTSYPAALPEVAGVGAIDADGKEAKFTPKDARWISLLARGVDLNAAYLTGEVRLPREARPVTFSGTANWAGCSFAAGVVTGIIAARTVPGRRSARDALAQLERSLRQQPQPGLLIN